MKQHNLKIISVVGARPNFMKVAPLHKAFQQYTYVKSKIVHTGQHYDEKMSKIFFDQLELPQPDYYLGVGSGSHAVVTAKVMMEFERILLKEKPDLVLVVGDVNSTLACAIVAKKLNIKLAHVEAGLRSGDRFMPEELNRIVVDSVSDYLFVTEQSGMINLARENVPSIKTFFVGNVMIDSLCNYQPKTAQVTILEELKVNAKNYVLMTMHRPSNVDSKIKVKMILKMVQKVSSVKKVIFPVHPRTMKSLKSFDLFDEFSSIPNLIILPPQGYLEFIHLMENSAVIITDSGGIQEESTYLKVPCLTVRSTTERPVTIELGTNVLIPTLDADIIFQKFQNCINGEKIDSLIPPFWDGKAAHRIAKILVRKINNSLSKKELNLTISNA